MVEMKESGIAAMDEIYLRIEKNSKLFNVSDEEKGREIRRARRNCTATVSTSAGPDKYRTARNLHSSQEFSIARARAETMLAASRERED